MNPRYRSLWFFEVWVMRRAPDKFGADHLCWNGGWKWQFGVAGYGREWRVWLGWIGLAVEWAPRGSRRWNP